MALESATFINGLVATNPVSTDGLAQADDHMRLIKSTILASFPSISGAINSTHTEINTATDGSTTATSTTLVDADQFVVNDDGTMVQVTLSDLNTYIAANHSITQINGITYPVADGNAGDAIVTDGAGTLSFAPGGSFSAGMLVPYAGAAAPTGWLLCFGQQISRTTYADLFTAIGTAYGIGDGVTTFNIPDLRGRVIAGKDDMGATSADRLTNQTGGLDGDVLGATGGAETHTLTTAELPAHTHSVPSGGSGSSNYALGGSSGSFSASQTTGSTGNGDAHNNIQPTIILNYIIKT
jgi:microcystin-dependent protein